jgi:hypothetical protein
MADVSSDDPVAAYKKVALALVMHRDEDLSAGDEEDMLKALKIMMDRMTHAQQREADAWVRNMYAAQEEG